MSPHSLIKKSSKYEDLSGLQFARWTVIEYAGHSTGNQSHWHCRCKCGTEKIVRGTSLKMGDRRGGSLSCGCHQLELATKHEMCGTRLYYIYQGMCCRCTRASNKQWHRYGGRGITICRRWRESFLNFVEDMGQPGESLSLDRIDPNGNYEPGNCRWATAKEQQRNRTNNTRLELNGQVKCLSEWAEVGGITQQQLGRRLRNGWALERAIFEPIDAKRSLWVKRGQLAKRQ